MASDIGDCNHNCSRAPKTFKVFDWKIYIFKIIICKNLAIERKCLSSAFYSFSLNWTLCSDFDWFCADGSHSISFRSPTNRSKLTSSGDKSCTLLEEVQDAMRLISGCTDSNKQRVIRWRFSCKEYCIVFYLFISIAHLSAWAIQKRSQLQHWYCIGVNTPKCYGQLWVKGLPKVLMWQLEWDS